MSQSPLRPRLGISGWLAIVVLAVFLMAAFWFANYAWSLFPGTKIGTNGSIAMVLGIVLSIVVGGGLMGLLFWSSRKGYDQ